MTTPLSNTSRQVAFDAMCTLVKSVPETEGYCVIYGEGKIRNLNSFEKIKNTILKFVKSKEDYEFRIASKKTIAKNYVAEKIGNMFLDHIKIQNSNSTSLDIKKAKEIAYTYIQRDVYSEKESNNLSSNSSESNKSSQNNDVEEQKIKTEIDNSFTSLRALATKAKSNPDLKKIISIIINNDCPMLSKSDGANTSVQIDTDKIITRANQALKIKNSLHCSSEQAVSYLNILVKTKTIDEDERRKNPKLPINFDENLINDRIESFIIVKKKFSISAEYAADYASLMGAKSLVTTDKDSKKEALKIVDLFLMKTNKKINDTNIVDEFKYFIRLYQRESYLRKYEKILPKNIEKYTKEMLNPAYDDLVYFVYEYQAASAYFDEIESAKKAKTPINESEIRNKIAADMLQIQTMAQYGI